MGGGREFARLSISACVGRAQCTRRASMTGSKAGARDPDLYRPNVGLAMFHRQGLVFLGKRAGAEGPYQWQMPQGGVDRGETPQQAAFRELEEEVGVKPALVDLLEETADWHYY